MSICCGGYRVDTPQSLMDAGRDVLTEIVNASDITDKEQCTKALLNLYRYRMIGSCDVERWVQAMTDRANFDSDRWNTVFMIYRNGQPSQIAIDLNDRVRTVTESGSSTVKDNTSAEREDIPETADAATSKYLSAREGSKRDVTGSDDRSVTEKERNGLEYELLGRAMDSVRDPYDDWAKRFDDLFLRMW